MNNNIASLLTNVYEIEGLLLVVTRHGKDTPSLVYERIQKAAHELNEQCKLLTTEEAHQEATAPVAAPIAQPQPAAAPAPAVQPVEEPVEEPAEVPVEDREPDEDISFEFIYDEEEETAPQPQEAPAEQPAAPVEEPADDPIEASQQSDDDMPVSPFSFDPDAPVRVAPAHTAPVQPVVETYDDDEVLPPPRHKAAPAQQIALEEKPKPNKSLRPSFSINDYYRFRRELFESDDNAMAQAMNLIEAMSSFQEVEDYFINDLGWDKDNEDVAYFMDIVRNYFA